MTAQVKDYGHDGQIWHLFEPHPVTEEPTLVEIIIRIASLPEDEDDEE